MSLRKLITALGNSLGTAPIGPYFYPPLQPKPDTPYGPEAQAVLNMIP